MQETAHFPADPRLAMLLGETFRPTETALKELLDHGWDSHADHGWITLTKLLAQGPGLLCDECAHWRAALIWRRPP